jgi:hypothetical protein
VATGYYCADHMGAAVVAYLAKNENATAKVTLA